MKVLYSYLTANKISLKGKVAVDLGCGKGRNSFSLIKRGISKVYSIDYVPKLIEEITRQAKKQKVEDKIVPICHNLTKPWPIKSHTADIVLDIFCFKHQTIPKDVKFYKKELQRILKPSGLLVISLASLDDDYYGTLPKTKVTKDVYKVTDPKIKISSLLYMKDSLTDELGAKFKLINFTEQRKTGVMHGKKYKRVTLKFLFKKEF